LTIWFAASPNHKALTFGLHRFSLTQFAARLAAPRLALDGLAPATTLGNDAIAARTVYEALARLHPMLSAGIAG